VRGMNMIQRAEGYRQLDSTGARGWVDGRLHSQTCDAASKYVQNAEAGARTSVLEDLVEAREGAYGQKLSAARSC
jgi:hypothetical protein